MSRRNAPHPRPLKWSPPVLSSPRIVELTSSNVEDRRVELSPGEDVLIRILEPITNDDVSKLGTSDAILSVYGGRNVVIVGGEFIINQTPMTRVSSTALEGDNEIFVDSTEGFGPTGILRINGEAIVYNSKTENKFYNLTRKYGYQNTGPGHSFIHFPDSVVYAGENSRQAIGLILPTGRVHIEGVKIRGQINDGIRAQMSPGSTLTIQNCRIEGATSDNRYGLDGHPDCVQVWWGPCTLRMDRVTMIPASNGGGFIDSDSRDSGGVSIGYWSDVEMLGGTNHKSLFSDIKVDSTWYITNCWQKRSVWGYPASFENNRPLELNTFDHEIEDDHLFVPAYLAGMRYLSPGYIS